MRAPILGLLPWLNNCTHQRLTQSAVLFSLMSVCLTQSLHVGPINCFSHGRFMAKARDSREGSEWAMPTIRSNKLARKTCSCLLPVPRTRRASFHAWRSSGTDLPPDHHPSHAPSGHSGLRPRVPSPPAPSQVTSEARVVVPGANPPDLDRSPAQGGQDQPLAQEVTPCVAERVRLGRHVRAVRRGPGAGSATGTTAAPNASTWFRTGRQSD